MRNEELGETRETKGLERWVFWLDDAIRVPGTSIRFGLDPVLGALLPTLGDAVTGFGALLLFVAAVKRGVPTSTLLRMLLNVLIDLLLGAVPVLGDLFDFGWKANRRNLELIEQHGAVPQRRLKLHDYLVLAVAAFCILAVLAVSLWVTGLLVNGLLQWVESWTVP